MTASGRELVERYIRAEAERDWDALDGMRHADWTETWPQTGERIVGSANWRRVHEDFPGYPEVQVGTVEGVDPDYVLSGAFTLVRLTGVGDAWVVQAMNRYADGSSYQVVKLVELRDDKVHAETTFFAPQSDAPEWRSAWVERI